MDRCASKDGHLVIFDRSSKDLEEKIFKREEIYQGQKNCCLGNVKQIQNYTYLFKQENYRCTQVKILI